MDLVQSSDHLCYVRCNFCNTVLGVEIPRKQLLETVTVKCGHCSNLSFLSTRPPPPHQHHHAAAYDPRRKSLFLQGSRSESKKGDMSATSSSSSTSSETCLSLKSNFVVKPPERRHRLPSAYNLFMKEEIQRIKAANPEVPHREAFGAAAKNWSKYIPNTPKGSVSCSTSNNV
nr:CRC2 [Erythranthe lewisii]